MVTRRRHDLLLAASLVAVALCFSAVPARAVDGAGSAIMAGYPLSPEHHVTLRDWLTFPKNRWAFRHMQSLFPTGPVQRDGAPAALAEGTPLDVAALTFTDGEGRKAKAADYFANENVDGFIVLHHGRIVYESYFDGMRPSQPHLWQSMTKSLTGLMAETLAAEGKLDLSRTAASYAPEIAETVWGKATLRNLLDMEVGADEPSTRAAQMPPDFWSKANFLAALKDPAVKPAGENGKTWYYTNSAPQTVGLAMTKATGRSWHDLAQEMFWSKLGAQADGNIWLDTDGQAAAAGGFSSTLRDAARFGEMIAARGKVGEQQVIPAAVVETIFRKNGNSGLTKRGNVAMLVQRPEMSYRSYWYQVNDGSGAVEALGIFGQHMYVNPTARVTIVQFGSYREAAVPPMNWTRLSEAIVAKLADAAQK